MCIYWTSIKRTNLTNNLNGKQDSTPCTQYMVTNGKDLFTRAGKKRARNPPFKKKNPRQHYLGKVIAQQTEIFSHNLKEHLFLIKT